jgi:hypothetical protein
VLPFDTGIVVDLFSDIFYLYFINDTFTIDRKDIVQHPLHDMNIIEYGNELIVVIGKGTVLFMFPYPSFRGLLDHPFFLLELNLRIL